MAMIAAVFTIPVFDKVPENESALLVMSRVPEFVKLPEQVSVTVDITVATVFDIVRLFSEGAIVPDMVWAAVPFITRVFPEDARVAWADRFPTILSAEAGSVFVPVPLTDRL